MPVRVVCSACSTQLNVRDEHAGRAVKCPKCGAVIPPAAPPPPVADATGSSAPPPLPTQVAHVAGSTEKPIAKPPRDRNDDETDDRPKRKRRRRDDDDFDDDRPRGRERERPAKKGGAGVLLGVVGLILLTCCGSGAFGIYYFVNKVKEVAEKTKEWVETINPRVNRFNYENLKEAMTANEVEAILGPGRIATADDVDMAYKGSHPVRAQEWKALAAQGRVAIWRNGDDYILCGFHPSAANGRLQMKNFQTANGLNSPNERFATDEDAAKPGWGKKKEPLPAISIEAWNLAKMYKDNPAQGDTNYKNRTLLVTGQLDDISLRDDELLVQLTNPPPATPPGLKIQCVLRTTSANAAWKLTRGQIVTIRGTCAGSAGLFVTLTDAVVDNQQADPAASVNMQGLANEFKRDAVAAEMKYDGKQIAISSASVVRVDGNSLILASPLKGTFTVRATFPAEFRSRLAAYSLKPGGRVDVKGEFSTYSDNELSLNRCWLVP